MPSDSPYGVSAASRTTSSIDVEPHDGATGPKTSSVYAGEVVGTSASTVGR